MDFKTQTTQQPQAQQAPASRTVNNVPQGSGNRKLWAIVLSVVVLVVLVASMWLLWQAKSNKSTTVGVETDKYQAVFMTNGQVYFGHLSKLDSGYTELTDVYYLQVQQSVQPAENKTAEQPQVSLTKLGNELHGPTDKMHISRDQILFWENLKNDSTVAKAIKEYQDKQ